MPRIRGIGALIRRHVFLYHEGETETAVSCFRAALREARTLTQRDPDTGKVEVVDCECCNHPPTDWAGALMYLVLLEQIGKVLRPPNRRARPKRRAGRTVAKEQDITRALRYFGPDLTTPPERDVLVALRNGFAHDFGLTHTMGPSSRWHKFVLIASPTAPLVKFPARRWNRRYDERSAGGPTVVNLTAFGDLVETIVTRIEREARKNALRLSVGITEAELGTRFAFRVLTPTQQNDG